MEGEMYVRWRYMQAHNMHNNPRFFLNILLDTVYEQQSIFKSKILLLFLLISLMVIAGTSVQRKTIFYYSCSWQTKNAIKLAKL